MIVTNQFNKCLLFRCNFIDIKWSKLMIVITFSKKIPVE